MLWRVALWAGAAKTRDGRAAASRYGDPTVELHNRSVELHSWVVTNLRGQMTKS